MHRRVYGRNGDVVILLCVIPPSTNPLLLIKFDKVFIAQIYFEIFKRPPIIFFFRIYLQWLLCNLRHYKRE